jgi:hypothetical protein
MFSTFFEIKNNKEQINHQIPEKRKKGVKKLSNNETLPLKNIVQLKVIITRTTNHRNLSRQIQ